MADDPPITDLLNLASQGDSGAADRLFAAVEPALRVLARRWMRTQGPGHILQTTALVNEAYVRLAGVDGGIWIARRQFFAVASRAMRHVLIDNARRARAGKRGGGARQYDLSPELSSQGALDVVELNDIFVTLGEADPECERIAELRVFGGLDHATVAEMLGCSLRHVERKWSFVKAFVKQQQG